MAYNWRNWVTIEKMGTLKKVSHTWKKITGLHFFPSVTDFFYQIWPIFQSLTLFLNVTHLLRVPHFWSAAHFFQSLTHFSRCDPLFKLWTTFPGVALFFFRVWLFVAIVPFFQMWPIFQGVAHFSSCDPLFNLCPFYKRKSFYQSLTKLWRKVHPPFSKA